MKKNVLNIVDVISTSRQLIENKCGERCTSIIVPVDLKDEKGEIRPFITHSICERSEEENAKNYLKTLKGLTKEEFIKTNPYCHISSYPIIDAGDFLVSFDMNDDIPCKVEFSEGYDYLDTFFSKFNNMRNELIDEGVVVKEDDIYQFLDISYNKKESKIKRLKKRFKNSK